MSIAQGTTHYGYPQVQLNDRPTFADFNPAFSDIDAKLYGLITGAATDEQAIADLGTAVGGLRTDLGGVSDTATAAKNKADANEEAIGLLGTQVSQNTTKLGTKIDSNAIAEPYNTAGTYAVDDVVTYQGQRYRCITAVAVAEPFDATKWTGEDVQTVLEQLGTPSAGDVTLSPISGMSATDVQAGIAELKSDLDEIGITSLLEQSTTNTDTPKTVSDFSVAREIMLTLEGASGILTNIIVPRSIFDASSSAFTISCRVISGSDTILASAYKVSSTSVVIKTNNSSNPAKLYMIK